MLLRQHQCSDEQCRQFGGRDVVHTVWRSAVYQQHHPHAVTHINAELKYAYDANGNQVQRASDNLIYDAENRLIQVKKGETVLATFVYNGDGERVKSILDGTTTAFVGNHLEWTGSIGTMKKYYYDGSQRVAVQNGMQTPPNYLLGDHLGSTSVMTNIAGYLVAEMLYKPFGEVRYTSGTTPTRYTYTGQYSNIEEIGLMYYNARWYDPALGRFVQADSLIPQPGDPQSWDRYSYVRNSPTGRTDPAGHMDDDGDGEGGVWNWICLELVRQDFLTSLVLKGSTSNGSWSAEDYKYYRQHREDILNNPKTWINPDPGGLEGFNLHIQRLATHYQPGQRDEFIRDFALLFGGIPSQSIWPVAAMSVTHGPHDLPFLNEGLEGWAPEYIDTKIPSGNQSHHYVGIFFISYYAGPTIGISINYARDTDNSGDILLGERAALDAGSFRRGGTILDFAEFIKALSIYQPH